MYRIVKRHRSDFLVANVSIHWRAPAVMLLALITGVGFAVGHHTCYKSLHMKEVNSSRYQVLGWTVSQQQVNLAAGTALAFLVKAALVLASSIASTQLFSRAINTTSRELQTLDDWFSAPDDIFSWLATLSFTSFGRTKELWSILNSQTRQNNAEATTDAASLSSLFGETQTRSAPKSLKDDLEELFFNVTISMASSEQLRSEDSNPYAPGPVNVTFDLYGNVYSYDSKEL